MSYIKMRRWCRLSCAALATLLVAACVTEPPSPVLRESVEQMTATVEAVDMSSRLVTLRRPDNGATAVVLAGPDVRNLAQVKVGDQVTVKYYEAIAAEVKAKDTALADPEQVSARLRSAVGQRPAGGIAQATSMIVVIESVDTSFNTVTFKRADGTQRTVAIDSPDSRAFIRELKQGDKVQVTYMEAVALSVQPAG